MRVYTIVGKSLEGRDDWVWRSQGDMENLGFVQGTKYYRITGGEGRGERQDL